MAEDKKFNFLEWVEEKGDGFVSFLKNILPSGADKVVDTLDKHSDKVVEYLSKFDDTFFTIYDVVDFLVNSIDAIIDWIDGLITTEEEKQEESGGSHSYGLDDWIPYEEVEDRAKAMSQKYKDLLNARKRAGEDIDISQGIPSLKEMFADDLAYDFFKELADSDKDSDVINEAFYCEAPDNLTPGYDPNTHTFTLECTPNALVDLTTEMHLNAVDGDTFHFYADQLSPTGAFTMQNGQSYENFNDFRDKNNLGSSTLELRSIGINSPELPHYNGQLMKESQISSMTIEEAMGKENGAVYRKYDYHDGNVTERDLSTPCDWYYDSSQKKYFEISETDAWDYYPGSASSVDQSIYQCNVIVTQDDSELNTLSEGYRARTVAYAVLKNADRLILKLDANGTKAQKTSGQHKLYYNHWWNADKAISAMIDQWQNAMTTNAPLTRLSYAPYGTDGYGRFVGEVYAYIDLNGKKVWVNVNKYVLAHVDATDVYTDIDSPELNAVFGDNSKAFELWSYNRDNLKYLDSFEEQTKKSYEERLKFHKDITGIDFKAYRSCTMMLGDTLFLIPPTAIRNVSSVDYEKVNVLRGKGSMVKGITAREQYLEIDLYFYNDPGINGIRYDQTLPNGKVMTYYMNGLRALIAQFKVAPYLPIENQYVNDILGIEAVSLVNLNVNTVEGFPRLLQATLTLRDFNYRIFMPDIPFDYGTMKEEDGEVTMDQISEMNPIFAKCIHWEIFRYYYQRVIAEGSLLSQYEYNSKEYVEQFYKSRNPLKPVNFCDKSDTISFYVPDEDWLSAALKIKKDKDHYGQKPETIELTELGKQFFEKVGPMAEHLGVNSTYARRLADDCQIALLDLTPGDGLVKRENVLKEDPQSSYGNSLVEYKGSSNQSTTPPESSTTVTIPNNIEDMFKGYKKIEVAGGDTSGTRQANAVVNIGFGSREYWGFTNEHGQLVKVVAKEIILQDDENEPVTEDGRYYPDEAKVPGVEYDDLDEGHVIADSLGGVSNAYNITPQDSTLNRTGAQAQIEEEIRSAGGCKNFVAVITYPDTETQIPSHYSYTYTINGNTINKEFDNMNPDTKPYDKDNLLKDLIMDVANNIESCGALKYDTTDEEYDTNTQVLTWKVNFKITGMNMTSEDMLSVKETLKDLMGLSSTNDIFPDDKLTVLIKTDIKNNVEISPNMSVECKEISAMNGYNGGETGGPTNIDETYDYTNPAAMQFVPFIEEVPLQGLAFNMSNTFTEMSLKIMDGSAPQYMGASDISIELRIITDNSLVISMLNTLPSHSMNIAKQYRRIITCWPIRVRQNYLNMAGLNEVLIDSVQIENLEGYPGTYDMRIRMTSVDRVMRQREMMRKLDSKQDVTTLPEQSIGSYFDIETTLSMAETYPDLDLPTLHELNQVGYRFIRYAGINRTYPDPDFYMVYGFEYTAAIIKKNLRDVFVKEGLLMTDEENVECNRDAQYEQMFSDQNGQKITTRLEKSTGIAITGLNGNAFYYTDAINTSDTIEANTRKISKNYDPEFAGNADALMTMTLFDVEEGWEIKPGWQATICPEGIEKYVRQCEQSNLSTDAVDSEIKTSKTYNFIFERRRDIINQIDKLLAEPIPFSNLQDNSTDMKDVHYAFRTAVDWFFSFEEGKKLVELMCPMGEFSTPDDAKFYKNVAKKWKDPNALQYIMAYAFASACCQTGEYAKLDESDWEKYYPNQYLKENGKEVEDDNSDYDNMPFVPLVCMDNAINPKNAKTKKDAVEEGFAFGMCKIIYESKDQILARIKPISEVDYLGEGKTFEMYKNIKDGFIDPYYNKFERGSDELNEYIQGICGYPSSNIYAFLRIALVYLRKQIIDGLIISDLDFIAKDYSEFTNVTNEIEKDAVVNASMSAMPMVTAGGTIDPMYVYETAQNMERWEYQEVTDTTPEQAEQQLALIDGCEESYAQAFCARWILPFAEAGTQGLVGPDTTTVDLIYNRRLSELNLISASLLGSIRTSEQMLTKFIMALAGNVIDTKNTDTTATTTSDSQKVLNVLMREAFTELSEDPRYYLLHSFYDMLVNDKRGRLLRAFPTYYVMFIDEGRRIGSWKLFDNFYNMSAISELTVSKSRKIPADTCSFVMTNMFGSYASEYDNSYKLNYVDTYSIRDTFTSIFSPREYITKEAAIKKRERSTEQTILKPGVRIHIRMGYGSDAAGLPVVFNGKIAEVDVGDVVSVIGQGDGIELVNPLNALGDVDATNLIESQQWVTLFKDLRGSLARGGLSPRNLLSQILCAEHGGVVKNFFRSLSGDAYYGDNPFGIYHFGDKRFADIFLDGEPTQNLYEVTDGTLLAGVNMLYPSETTWNAAPTLNTTIQDKTFWDLLTLSAYSGVGYIGAVRDFGFRSTVCLCKRNHYYAYAYAMTDGKYIEKRKPFQQFHYYDSYTDIIYNSIKASEKNMKTNATGIWEGTDAIWGSEQKTCGPIYLDFNIYPEYQKSMTVDTGLIAAGNGGIDIPFITSRAEEWNFSANTDKVNKTLAERVTLNTLRESVMNMYVGELCVIGDPSVKPYDRISITDTYEDMEGQMEVEAVVYSMNAATGFTTTIYPDLIVRQDDPHEIARQQIISQVSAGLLSVVTARIAIIAPLARISSRLFTSSAGLFNALAAKVGVEGATSVIAKTSIGKLLHVQKTGGFLKAIGSFLSTATVSTWVYMAVAAAAVYIITQNAKSVLTRWIRNLQALDVYPIFKNQRPFIAGMNGHKGSVVGYAYTEEDANDSVQGIIEKCIGTIDSSLGGFGKILLNIFLNRKEYEATVANWSNTLTTLNGQQPITTVEGVYQEALGTVSKNHSAKLNSYPMIRTKYRLRSFDTQGGSSPTYLKYRILGVSVDKNHQPTVIDGTDIHTSSIYTNKNLLALYPIEDDIDVKKAIAGTHSVVKKLTIAHSTGPVTANIPFESGARVIRFIAEQNPTGSLEAFPILDMPMIQEDALYLLKFILDNDNLQDKKLEFMSGARINDIRTWKNTGFAFELNCNDSQALKATLDALKDEILWTVNGEQRPFFAYQQSDTTFVISVYPEEQENTKEEETTTESE